MEACINLSRFFVTCCAPQPPGSTLFPYTTLFRSVRGRNLIEGIPKTITMTDEEIREALSDAISTIINSDNASRSEEHTSELQSHVNLVCRLLLEKKKIHHIIHYTRFPITITHHSY